RGADEDNPRGYFEFEAVKRIKHCDAWLAHARSKAVKVISGLLPELPRRGQYSVIFMRRTIDEVVRSQDLMMRRRGQDSEEQSALRSMWIHHLEDVFEHLESRE